MSLPNRDSSRNKFEMPETFSFGLEERSSTLQAIKLELNEENPDCHHEWYERGEPAQTLRHEGKTILECRGCKRTVAVFDWKLNNASS